MLDLSPTVLKGAVFIEIAVLLPVTLASTKTKLCLNSYDLVKGNVL